MQCGHTGKYLVIDSITKEEFILCHLHYKQLMNIASKLRIKYYVMQFAHSKGRCEKTIPYSWEEERKQEKRELKGICLDWYTPRDSMEKKDLHKTLEECLGCLENRRRLVLELFYYSNLTLKQIGKSMSISSSRASQLHREGLSRMRNYLICKHRVDSRYRYYRQPP
jgi:RNA polymerase sigma factor (sigma-70 family)